MSNTSENQNSFRRALHAIAGKYREVILSILLFIVLDLGVLVLNFYISFQIQGDAAAVNLSGRQRMLSQRTAKVLYQLKEAQALGKDTAKPLAELKAAYQLFDTTLTALDKGGEATGGDGKPMTLAAVPKEARAPLEQANQVWGDCRMRLQTVLSEGASPSAASILGAIEAADANNLKLLGLMNDLTTALEHIAQRKAGTLRTVQTVAIVLVLINFGIIMVHVIGKLKRSDEAVEEHSIELENANSQLESANTSLESAVQMLENTNGQLKTLSAELQSAKQESDTIFATVRQGLFLLGPDKLIGAQASEELKSIFQTDDFSDRNFLHLLKPLVPEKRYQTVCDYTELLFQPRKNDKQLQKFNPLKRVELNFPRPEGGFQSKFVEFTFQRIVASGEISRVLVTAMDVTERVKLEEQIRVGEERRQKQFELLFELLQVEGIQLRKFIEEAGLVLERINSVFMETAAERGSKFANPVQDKVQRVFRLAHDLKSQAASLGLLLFEKAIHQIEDQLNQLRKNPALVNEDLFSVLVAISNFQTEIEEASELIEKIGGLRSTFGGGAKHGNGSMAVVSSRFESSISHLGEASAELMKAGQNLCDTVGKRLGKNAKLAWKIADFEHLDPEQRKVLKTAILQLVRNSLVHGIELPEDREAIGKPPVGQIQIEIAKVEGGKVRLRCRDDGAGLDAAAIREQGLRSGLLDKDEAAKIPDGELYKLIFEPGFSTASGVTEDAGRGVGLDVVRASVVEMNGEIQMEFASGRFCELRIILPELAAA
jgi:HPt (histidine-containing phosphotransfer) domain-containing protein